MNTSVGTKHAACGFSMIELLVTVVLAGIIFAAMVPVFASALKQTSRDNLRVTATNLAQDRIEKIRSLRFVDITDAHLNDPAFARDLSSPDSEFGSSFTPTGSTKTYTIDPYYVEDVPSAADPKYKKITVTVRWSAGANDYTTMKTVIMNPDAVTTGSTPSSSATPAPYSTTGTNYVLNVFCTNDTVTAAGVTCVRVDSGYNQTMSPSPQHPSPANGLESIWTNLVGGPDVRYRVTVTFQARDEYGVLHPVQTYVNTYKVDDNVPVIIDTNPYVSY